MSTDPRRAIFWHPEPCCLDWGCAWSPKRGVIHAGNRLTLCKTSRWLNLHEGPESLSSNCCISRHIVTFHHVPPPRHATTWERIIVSRHVIKSWEARDASCRKLIDVVRAVLVQHTAPVTLRLAHTSGAHHRLNPQHLPGTGTVRPPRPAPRSLHRSRHTRGIAYRATEPLTLLLYRLHHRGTPNGPIVGLRESNETQKRHPAEGTENASNDVFYASPY